jgi:hypothetical protein
LTNINYNNKQQSSLKPKVLIKNPGEASFRPLLLDKGAPFWETSQELTIITLKNPKIKTKMSQSLLKQTWFALATTRKYARQK